MDYLTLIIDCKNKVDKKQFELKNTLSSLYLSSDDLTNTRLNTTLIINNHSKMFIKNVNLSTIKQDLKNINIINTNQSKLYGVNVNLPTSNLSSFGTLIVNTNNSQSTISSNQINDLYLINSRNDNGNFYNFPSPFLYPNSYIIPTLISNGERTKWSWNYGYIKQDTPLLHFILELHYNLNGQSFTFTINEANKYLLEEHGITNFHNGTLTFRSEREGGFPLSNVNIQDCASKIILENFKFTKTLNINNCRVVYLKNCSWIRESGTLPEVTNMNYNLYEWKQGKTDWVENICLSVNTGSKVYIENTTDLKFSNFFIGIKANNNSLIYLQNKNIKKIIITENLSNYSQTANRPVFLLACNGSRIYSGTYQNIEMHITYPAEAGYYYKPINNEETFELTLNLYLDNENKNYRRMKSCLVALKLTSNNSQIYTSFFRTDETYLLQPSATISVPLFGLFQIAKPGNGEGGWYGVNAVHMLSGTEENHIIVGNNGEYRMNLRDGQNNISVCTNQAFMRYNAPYSYVPINMPYDGTQPHLAHYYLHQIITKPTGEEYENMTDAECPPQNIINTYVCSNVQMVCVNIALQHEDLTPYQAAISITRCLMYHNTYKMKDI